MRLIHTVLPRGPGFVLTPCAGEADTAGAWNSPVAQPVTHSSPGTNSAWEKGVGKVWE